MVIATRKRFEKDILRCRKVLGNYMPQIISTEISQVADYWRLNVRSKAAIFFNNASIKDETHQLLYQ